MSSHLYSFAISGKNKKDLIQTLTFIQTITGQQPKGFCLADMCHSEIENIKPKALVFLDYVTNDKKNQTYPFQMTPIALAEQIEQYINNMDSEQLAAFGEEPNGYEEEYEYGWELFSPDWYSDKYGIEDYDMATQFAVRPKKLEYGK